jgi:hypothetical protein
MKTYDLTDEMAAAIRAAGIDLPEPVCDTGDRLVTNAASFREHFESDNEVTKFLDTLTDEQIDPVVPDPYDNWARSCNSALRDLGFEGETE